MRFQEIIDPFFLVGETRLGAAVSRVTAVVMPNVSWTTNEVQPLGPTTDTSNLTHYLFAHLAQRQYAEAGGLMAYAADFSDLFRRTATFVDKILKGAKPSDLPVEQPTKWEFVINLKTAKALGLTIPQTLLLRADQVIDQ